MQRIVQPDALEEDRIPDNFNELDLQGDPESSVLRNIIAFQLLNDEGQCISFSDLGEGKPLGTLVGEVIEPLHPDIRQQIMDRSCTVSQQPVNQAATELTSSDVTPTAPDDMMPVVETAGNPDLVPWFDIERMYEKLYRLNGNRLPPLKRTRVIIRGIEDWAVEYSYALPSMYLVSRSGIWYRVAGPLYSGHAAVVVEKHEMGNSDPWKLSLTKPVPNVVSDEDNQKPLVCDPYVDPCRYLCDDAYKSYFQDPMETFFVSAHVVFSLLDLMVYNSRACNLDTVCTEVVARSLGAVTKELVMKHHVFLAEQIKSLQPPIGISGKPLTIVNCTFVNQLQREGAKLEKSFGKVVPDKSKKVLAPESNKKRALESLGFLIPGHFKAKPTATTTTTTTTITVTPMRDADYWKCLAKKNLFPAPFPYPASKANKIPFGLPRANLVGELLQVWSTLMNFRSYLNIPEFTPDLLALMLMMDDAYAPRKKNPLSREDINAYNAKDLLLQHCASSDAYSFLSELHITLMLPILLAKAEAQKGHFSKAVKSSIRVCPPSKFLESSEESANLLHTTPNDFYNSAVPEDSLLLLDAKTFDKTFDSEGGTKESVSSFLRMGDVWVESMRLLIAEKISENENEELCMPEYSAPLLECEAVLSWLLTVPEAKLLATTKAAKMDETATDDGSEVDAEDNGIPVTLDECLTKLKNGEYSLSSIYELPSTKTDIDTSTPSMRDLKTGDAIDYYDHSVGYWCGGTVIDGGASEDANGEFIDKSTVGPKPRRVLIRPRDGGSITSGDFDVSIPVNSELLAPFKSYSEHISTRYLPPPAVNDEVGANNEVTGIPMEVSHPGVSRTPHSLIEEVKLFASDVNRILDIKLSEFSEEDDSNMCNVKAVKALFNQVFEMRVLEPIRQRNSLFDLFASSDRFKIASTPEYLPDCHRDRSVPIPPQRCRIPSTDSVSLVEGVTIEEWRKCVPSISRHSCCNEFQELVTSLQSIEYVLLPIELKLQCLRFFCLELLSNTAVYELIVTKGTHHKSTAVGNFTNLYNTKIRDRSSGAHKSAAMSAKGESASKAELSNSSVGPKKANLATKPTPVDDDGLLDGVASSRRSGRFSNGSLNGRPSSTDDVAATSEKRPQEGTSAGKAIGGAPAVESSSQVALRIFPLGEDRGGRLYWVLDESYTLAAETTDPSVLANPTHYKRSSFSRLFCEEVDLSGSVTGFMKHNPSRWLVFDEAADVDALLCWLSDWGYKEVRLKRNILEWKKTAIFRDSETALKETFDEPVVEIALDLMNGDKVSESPVGEERDSGKAEEAVAEGEESLCCVDDRMELVDESTPQLPEAQPLTAVLDLPPDSAPPPMGSEDLNDKILSAEYVQDPEIQPLSSQKSEECLELPESLMIDTVAGSPIHASGRSRRSVRNDNKYKGDFLVADEMNKALTINNIKAAQNINVKKKRPSIGAAKQNGDDELLSPDFHVSKKQKKGGSRGDSTSDMLHSASFSLTGEVLSAIQKQTRENQIEDTMKEIARIKYFYCSSVCNSNHFYGVTLELMFSNKIQLGVGVREVNGKVFVTGYHYDAGGLSTGRSAGVRLGDRIVYFNGRLINSITSLQSVIGELSALKTNECDDFKCDMFVLRYPAPLAQKMIHRGLCDDKLTLQGLKKQSAADFVRVPEITLENEETPQSAKVDDMSASDTPEPLSNSIAEQMSESSPMDVTSELRADANSPKLVEAISNNSLVDPYSSAAYDLLQRYYSIGPRITHFDKESSEVVTPMFPEHHVYPTDCIGKIIHMLLESTHPYLCGEKWRLNEAQQWPLAIYEQILRVEGLLKDRSKADPLQDIESSISKVAIEVANLKCLVKSCLLALIAAFSELGTAYNADTESPIGNRVRWLTKIMSACDMAFSWQAISSCVTQLYNGIKWSHIEIATSTVDRERFMRQFDAKRKFGYIPRTGDAVIYYPEGHSKALDGERKRGHIPAMWTSSAYPFSSSTIEEGVENNIYVCTVTKVLCYPCGHGAAARGRGRGKKEKGKSDSEDDVRGSHPFANVEMTIRGCNGSLEGITALSKLAYTEDIVSNVSSFSIAVSRAARKFQNSSTTGFAVCNDETARAVLSKIISWVKDYECSKFPLVMEPVQYKRSLTLASILESNVKNNAVFDDEASRNRYVSALLIALTNTLNLLCANPLFGPFLLFVDAEQFPDYYGIIKKPIALRMIETNILELKYTHVSLFYTDMLLLHDNCVLYCKDKYPDMITLADSLLYCSVFLCERLLRNGLQGTNASAHKITSETSSPTPADFNNQMSPPLEEKTINVGIRLFGENPEYIIPMQKYVAAGTANTKGTYPAGQCFSMPYYLANADDQGGVAVENSIGMITGHKPSISTRLVPWEWLSVSWIGETAESEEFDLPRHVNPWEIELLSYPIDLKKLNYSL